MSRSCVLGREQNTNTLAATRFSGSRDPGPEVPRSEVPRHQYPPACPSLRLSEAPVYTPLSGSRAMAW